MNESPADQAFAGDFSSGERGKNIFFLHGEIPAEGKGENRVVM